MQIEDNELNPEIAKMLPEDEKMVVTTAENGEEAVDIVSQSVPGRFDFIFMDAAKGQYIHYMPEAVRLLSDGGILMSDNVLQDGDIIESRFAVERRNRTIHSRMRDYLYELKHSDVLETSIIPLGDGVALSIKKKKEEKENR